MIKINRKYFLTSVSLLCSLFTFVVNAEDLNMMALQIIDNNADLKTTKAINKSEILSLKSENNLNNPDVDFNHLWGSGKVGNKWDISVAQSFEWPSIYKNRNKVYKNQKIALNQLYLSKKLSLLVEIKSVLIDIVYYKKITRLLNEQLKLIDELTNKYNEAYQAGQTTIVDINKLKLENISYSQKIVEANARTIELKERLKTLNGGEDVTEYVNSFSEYYNETILTYDEYISQMNAFDPDVKYNGLMYDLQNDNINIIQSEAMPSFKLGYQHSYEIGDHFNGINFGITLPFFTHRNKKTAIKARQDAYKSAESSIVIYKSAQIKSLREKVVSQLQQLNKTKPLIFNESNKQILRKSLDGGQISLLTFIQETNYFIDAEINYLTLENGYYSDLNNLNKYFFFNYSK